MYRWIKLFITDRKKNETHFLKIFFTFIICENVEKKKANNAIALFREMYDMK